MTYQQIRTWQFDRDRTNANLSTSDEIVTLNAAAATVNAVAKTLSPVIRGFLSLDLDVIKEKLFVKRNVSQLLFDGYPDPILKQTKYLPASMVPVKMDKIGYFYPRNGSDWFDGVFNMHTGEDDLSKLGQIAQWNFTADLPYFPGQCGEVRGAGDFFSPGQTDDYVELFSNDLKRPLRLDFVDKDVQHGIHGNIYKLSKNYFANKTEYPPNWCFNPGNEIPSGLFNASSANYGAPIFMSQPHFYQADPYYMDQIESGLNPKQDLHESVFFVEPTTGLPVSVIARFQVNLLIEPFSQVTLFKNIRKTYFPAVWFETKVELPKLMNTEIWLVSNLKSIFSIVGFVLLGASIATLAIVGIFHCAKNAKKTDENPELNRSLFDEQAEQEEVNDSEENTTNSSNE